MTDPREGVPKGAPLLAWLFCDMDPPDEVGEPVEPLSSE
jgi:hypothetical protein